jgi:hypothetical protein
MKFYIENFALRLLFCIATCVAATNLGLFIRASFITHEPFAFNFVSGLLFPLALGAVAAFMWKPQGK